MKTSIFRILGLLLIAGGLLFAWRVHRAAPSVQPIAKSSPVRPQAAPATVPAQTTAPTPAPVEAAPTNTAPQFVAPRYDSTHVIFLDNTFEDRFDLKTMERLPKLKPGAAELVGLEYVYDVDADFVQQYPKLFRLAHIGEEWQVQISAGSTAQVSIERPVLVRLGCMAAGGFLAKATPQDEQRLSSSPENYFVISHTQSAGSASGSSSRIGQLKDWKPDSELDARIRKFLETAMKQELTKVRRTMAPQYKNTAGDNQGWSQQWEKYDEQLTAGEGKLAYQVRAFQLMPDGIPRLYVGAEWVIGDKVVFVLTAWLRQDASLTPENVSSKESEWMRTTEFDYDLDMKNLPKVLNVFADRATGSAQLLMYSIGSESFNLDLLRYADKGPVPMEVGVNLSGGC